MVGALHHSMTMCYSTILIITKLLNFDSNQQLAYVDRTPGVCKPYIKLGKPCSGVPGCGCQPGK